MAEPITEKELARWDRETPVGEGVVMRRLITEVRRLRSAASLGIEAADLIRRLQARVAELEAALDTFNRGTCCD